MRRDRQHCVPSLTPTYQEAAVNLGFVSSEQFKCWVVPLDMCGLGGSPRSS